MVIKAVEIRKLIPELFVLVQRLEACAEGRPFTPDGHMVGSIGEVLASVEYGLSLQDPSNKGFDAIHVPSGTEVEIKATFGKRVALRCCPQHLLVLVLDRKTGGSDTVFNGPGAIVWNALRVHERLAPSNGQYLITVTALRRLQEQVPPGEQLLPVKDE
jgi:hypothetical protein